MEDEEQEHLPGDSESLQDEDAPETVGLGQPPRGPAAHDNGGGWFRGKCFPVLLVLAIVAFIGVSCGGDSRGAVPAGPLDQVPNVYVQVV